MTKDAKICLMDGVSQSAIASFQDAGFTNIKLFPNSLPVPELIQELSDAQAIGIRSKTKLSAEILQQAPQLKCIGRYGIGVDNVDLKESGKLGISVFNGPFSSTRSVAEWVIAAIFGLSRKLAEKTIYMQKGQWIKSGKNCFELRGKTLGLIGYGNIAVQISIMAEALGMKVIFSDVRAVLPVGQARQTSLNEVLSQSDFISLHVPALPSTKNMINEKTIAQMKKGSFLINSSRGTVVDIEAVVKALDSEHLNGAAFDVFPEEPKSKDEEFSSALRGEANVILTPHIAGSTEESQASLGTEVSGKMVDCLLNGNFNSALNKVENPRCKVDK